MARSWLRTMVGVAVEQKRDLRTRERVTATLTDMTPTVSAEAFSHAVEVACVMVVLDVPNPEMTSRHLTRQRVAAAHEAGHETHGTAWAIY